MNYYTIVDLIKEYIFAPKIKVKNGQEHTFTFISPSHWSLA